MLWLCGSGAAGDLSGRQCRGAAAGCSRPCCWPARRGRAASGPARPRRPASPRTAVRPGPSPYRGQLHLGRRVRQPDGRAAGLPAVPHARHLLRAVRPGLRAGHRPGLRPDVAVPDAAGPADAGRGGQRDRRADRAARAADQAARGRAAAGDLPGPGQPDPVGDAGHRLRVPIRPGDPHAAGPGPALRVQHRAGGRATARRRAVRTRVAGRDHPAGPPVPAPRADRGGLGGHPVDPGQDFKSGHRHRRAAAWRGLDHLQHPRRVRPGLRAGRYQTRADQRAGLAGLRGQPRGHGADRAPGGRRPGPPSSGRPTPPPIGGPGSQRRAVRPGPGGRPACFQTARYGSNTARFSYQPGGGPGGAGAEPSG